MRAVLIAARLRADAGHQIKAVCVVHNETSTGATSDIAAVRRALDDARHPALLIVDTISGLASAEYRLSSSGEQRLLRYQVVLPVSGTYRMIRVFVARALRELPTMSLDLVQLERETIGDTTVEAQISFTFHLPR